jgi:hypothetical protein
VNFFHFGGGPAQELLSCLVEASRKRHTDPEGKYTGFLAKEERVTEKADI